MSYKNLEYSIGKYLVDLGVKRDILNLRRNHKGKYGDIWQVEIRKHLKVKDIIKLKAINKLDEIWQRVNAFHVQGFLIAQ